MRVNFEEPDFGAQKAKRSDECFLLWRHSTCSSNFLSRLSAHPASAWGSLFLDAAGRRCVSAESWLVPSGGCTSTRCGSCRHAVAPLPLRWSAFDEADRASLVQLEALRLQQLGQERLGCLVAVEPGVLQFPRASTLETTEKITVEGQFFDFCRPH